MDLKKLAEPFPAEAIEWRIARAGRSGTKIWAKCLAYVTSRAIMDRLDDVVGPANWRVSYDLLGGADQITAGIICKLELKVGGEWVAKEDGAEQTDIEAFKGGISSALKRAGVAWGIGRYLYDLPEGWAQVVDQGTRGAEYAKTKDVEFYWLPPALPDWALPPKAAAAPAATVNPVEPPKAKAPAPKGEPAKPAQSSPAAEGERSELNRRLLNLYRPFLDAYPNTQFAPLLHERYGVGETRLMDLGQIKDLLAYLEKRLCERGEPAPKETKAPAPGQANASPEGGQPLPATSKPSAGDLKALAATAKKRGWASAEVTRYMTKAFGVKKSADLSLGHFNLLRSVIENATFAQAIAEVEGDRAI